MEPTESNSKDYQKLTKCIKTTSYTQIPCSYFVYQFTYL